MTEQSLFVLAALAPGELHGYGIAREAAELSGGTVRLSAGTLYGALTRLVREGAVEQTREDVVDGRRRRYYRITPAGEEALATESARLRAVVDALSSRAGRRATSEPGLA